MFWAVFFYFVLLSGMTRARTPIRLFSSKLGTSSNSGSSWPQFLVEFRGHQPYMRLDEFIDASATILGNDEMAEQVRCSLITVIPDPLSAHHDPICAYFRFPNADALSKVVERCCLVRSAVDVWGDGNSLEAVHQQALSSGRVDDYFNAQNTSENSWRVNFRRYGRVGDSGLDPKEKRTLLSKFGTLLRSINGKVTLSGAKHKMMILEDWSTFHEDVVISKFSKGKGNSSNSDLDSLYKPSRYLFGIKIAEGPTISSKFEVRYRPYIGTTTMDAISSHLAANAAQTQEGHIVLDPFCGTGSLLISSSFLGGDVIGSDIDADCLGLMNTTEVSCPERSKNANFIRRLKGQVGLEWNQLNESTSSNFMFYGLQQKLISLKACSIEEWLTADDLKDMKFDAIVSDPPFGKREKTLSSTNHNIDGVINTITEDSSFSDFSNGFHEDSTFAITKLMEVASQSLKNDGKLIFWLPTEENLNASEVKSLLHIYERSAGINNLLFQRTKQQIINNSLWRWLCVYKKHEKVI